MYKLVIAEKPSVAQTIAKVLKATERGDGFISGNGYIVSWCVGHLIGLAAPEAYGEQYKTWSFENLPIIPTNYKFAVNTDTKKQFFILSKLMNDSSVTEIVCATDAGREGECIFRYVYNAAKCQKPFKRLWVSSMEDIAIKEGFANLRPGRDYDKLFEAGLCRAEADWVVGMNASRLFSIRYNTKLSVGRVQTPTLDMIVERDNKIKNFKKEKFFSVEIGTKQFPAFAVSERIDNENTANKLTAACNDSSANVKSVTSERKTAKPPKLYDLTTLQREANRYFGYTAQQTLDCVQSLYEKKLCTYPRTDSQYITEDMHTTFVAAVDVAKEFTGISSDNVNPMPVINNSKVSDHHAIIITQEIKEYDCSQLKDSENHILFLIASRMIISSSEPHIYEATTEEKGVQIIFCDIAVHGDEEQGKWSVYDNIKDELIKRGMPEKEICFAGDAKNQKERNEMYAQLRNGTKRLVISSTQKMGTGANVQTRLAALHHLDIPWKPSDLEQQNGRILRQGNQFSDVGIYHYVTEGTFDAYMLSILTTKQRFISQTMSGEAPGRSCSDVDEMVLNYSEMQAIASGDPRIKEKIELDGEVAKLRLLESEYYNEIYKMQDKIPQYKASLEYETTLLSRCEIDLANRDIALKSMPSDEFAGMKIEGVVFKERKEAGVAMRPFIQKVMNNQSESCTIGEYGGFMIGIEKMKRIDQHARLFITGASGVKYFTTDVELASDTGNVQRIENLFKTAIEKKIEITKANIETDTQNIQEASSALERPFERAEELAMKSARLEQLNKELNVDKADEQFINGDDEIDEPEQDQEIKKSKPKR